MQLRLHVSILLFSQTSPLKGPGHEIEFYYLDKNEQLWRTSTSFRIFKRHLIEDVVIAISHTFMVKTYRRNNNWRDITKFLCGPCCFLLVHCWFLLVHCYSSNMFFKIAARLLEGCGEILKSVCGPRICFDSYWTYIGV
jgi:hypothetical protein